MNNNFVYYGKSTPSSCAVILTASNYSDNFSYTMYNYITTEAFNYQCEIEDSSKWFCTFPYGIDALHIGAKILNIGIKFFKKETPFSDINDLALFIENELKQGPFIFGPLQVSTAWGNIESRFFRGYAQFVYVTGIQENQYILQDPGGCPNLYISIETFWAMIKNCGPVFSLRFLWTEKPQRDLKNIYHDILKQVIHNRLILLKSPNNYLHCMQKLAVRFNDKLKVKSSESASLKYSVRHLSRSLYLLREFLQSYDEGCDRGGALKSLINKWILILEEYLKALNPAYTEQGFDSCKAVEKIISIQVFYEKELDVMVDEIKKHISI